jgi:hypothetical protein
MTLTSRSPVSFPAHVARLPKNGMPVVIEATAEQRAALAAEHGLLGVRSFRADLMVRPWKAGGAEVTGVIEADIVQECVVTLDPLENHVSEPVEVQFLPENSNLAPDRFDAGGEIMLDAEGPDAPETFADDSIDVGALAEEFFAMGIDPYPRRQGAEQPPLETHPETTESDNQLRRQLEKLMRRE